MIAIAFNRIVSGKLLFVATSYKVKDVPGTFIDSSCMNPRMAHKMSTRWDINLQISNEQAKK